MKNELLKICGKFGVKAGRKARQKARKLAKNNPLQTVRVISKNGYVLYSAKFFLINSRLETWINSKEKGMIPDYRTNGKF